MSSFSIEFKKCNQPHVKAKRWCLDYPTDQDDFLSSELLSQGITIKGWVLAGSSEYCELELQQADKSIFFSLNVPRPDVVRTILQEDPSSHPQLLCGFDFQSPLTENGFAIWFHQAGQRELLWEGKVVGKQHVLHGDKNWLFLDNDTNQSVDQHLGVVLMDLQTIDKWQTYFSLLQRNTKKIGARYALIVAPSKEAVYPHLHPFKRAITTPISQLSESFSEQYSLVYPADELRTEEPFSFLRTDTHWSVHGALLATLSVLDAFNIDRVHFERLFLQDTFKRVYKVGDLGVKLFPPVGAYEWVCANFSMYSALVYDNGLPNFGRVMIFNKPDAIHKFRCVVFGASSSYSMLSYLCRIFEQVVFVHTAGNVDSSMLDELKPDYVMCQTNERYIVRAPEVGYSVKDTIKDKWLQLTPAQKKELCVKRQAILNKNLPSWLPAILAWLPEENSCTSVEV